MKFILFPKTIGRLVCTAAFWLSVTSFCSAQSYHQLTNDDFQGRTGNISMGVIAYTNCSIDFQYVANKQNGYYRLDFDIRLILNNNKSWIDRRRVTSDEMLTQILKHEQGHYTIAFMEQQELIRTVGRTVFHEDYQSEARAIFNRIDTKYKQLNLDYDADTHHMLNREQQQSWDAYFQKQLEFMPPG
jgi:hypothetical protein